MLATAAMNALDLLIKQHRTTKEALERMSEDDIDPDEMRLMADELVAHMVIEEHVFYPRVKELDEDLVRESFEEHAVARFELARAMMAEGEEKKARLTVLKELVEHHVEEEEDEMFPKIRRGIPQQELDALGVRMEKMFDKAVEAGLEKLVVGGVELRGQRRATPRARAAAAKTGRARAAGAKRGARGRTRAASR